MGLDFIKNKGGRPWKKSWATGLDQLKAPGLFDLAASPATRTISVGLYPSVSVRVNERLIAQLKDGKVLLCREFNSIGVVDRPPEDVVAILESHGGFCFATVRTVGIFGDSAEVEVQ